MCISSSSEPSVKKLEENLLRPSRNLLFKPKFQHVRHWLIFL